MFAKQKPPAAAAKGLDSLANRPRAWNDRRLFLREERQAKTYHAP
jgi:hypothetical protein